MRNYITKVDGSAPSPSGILSALEDNTRFAELTNAVVSASIALDPVTPPDGYVEDRQMLAQTLARYASGGLFCTDTGAANAYVLKLLAAFVAPKAYFTGLRVVFYAAYSSSGASTINAFGLGSKKLLRPDGTAIQSGDITANRLVDAFYDEALDSGAGAFKLAPWAIPAAIFAPSAVPGSGEGIVVDNLYHVSLNFPGLNPALPVSADVFAFYSQSGVHHRKISLANLITLVQAGLTTTVTLAAIAPLIKIEERRPSKVARRAPGNSWAIRPLSDLVDNQITNASFDPVSHLITLPPGSYRAEFVGVVAKSGNHRARLFDVTSQTLLGTGNASDSYVGASISTPSLGATWFQIPAGSPHQIALQHWSHHSGDDDPYWGDASANDIGSGNYFVDSFVSIVKEG